MKAYIIILFVVISSPFAAMAQDRGLQVSLSTDKSSYRAGEPVYLNMCVVNQSAQTVEVPNYFNSESSDLGIRILGPIGDQVLEFVPLTIMDVDGPGTPLAGGDSLCISLPIFFGGRGFSFLASGTYKIEARMAWPKGKPLPSNLVSVNIGPETPVSKMIMFSGEKSLQAGKFMVWQSGDHLTEGLSLLEEVVQKGGDSLLSAYVKFYRGVQLSQPFRDYKAGKVREPQNQEALNYLAGAPDALLPEHMRVQKSLAKASCLIRMGDKASALIELSSLRQMYGNRPALRAYFLRLERLEAAANKP